MFNKLLDLFKTKKPIYSFNGDVIVFHKYKAAYFAIPKVANSSLKSVAANILAEEIDENYVDENWKLSQFRIKESRKALRKKRILIKSFTANEEKYWKFTVVRNPWDRLISCYAQKVVNKDSNGNLVNNIHNIDGVAKPLLKEYGTVFNKNMQFSDFVDFVFSTSDEESNKHFRSQHTFVTEPSGKLLVDYVGHFEDLTNEFRYIKKKCAFPQHIEIPHLLKSQRKDNTIYYSDAAYEKVITRYARDFSLFGYETKL